jgi:hypothetical protein
MWVALNNAAGGSGLTDAASLFPFLTFIQACPPMPLKPIKLKEQSESI